MPKMRIGLNTLRYGLPAIARKLLLCLSWLIRPKGKTLAEMLIVGPEEEQKRIAICSGCKHRVGTQCSVCSCLISLKVKFVDEFCPKGFW